MEILAPAGNFEAFLAAVHNGADAVYLGGKNFGARAFAGNFAMEEIEEAVRYAHLRKMKVYVTVNTLIRDEEMPAAVEFVLRLYETGVDAVIVQDWGLVHFLRQHYPEISLNASTQMTLHNSEGCLFAEEMGFRRVILSREVSLAEMKTINQKVKVETEAFVHGALCICYSGQCLFSSLVGGRSGNRGRCAQPCRLRYSLFDSKGHRLCQAHLLSPKDLNGIWQLQDLADAGIASAKIEGRMKRPEYVAAVVSAYAAVNRSENPKEEAARAEKKLEQAFNREFTSGYLLANQGADLMSYQRPNNRGTKLGRIEQVRQDGILVKLEADLALWDGVEIWVSKGGRQGFTVRKLFIPEADLAVEEAEKGSDVLIGTENTGLDLRYVKAGDRLFKTLDYRQNQKARSTFAQYDTLPVSMKLIAHEGEPVTLKVTYNKRQAEYTDPSFSVPLAKKHPATLDSVNKQLSRLGGSGWYLRYLETEMDENIMLPASVLNHCRRQAIAKLEDLLLADYKREPLVRVPVRITPLSLPSAKPQLAVFTEDIRSARAALEGGADLLYLSATVFRGKKEPDSEALRRLTATDTPVYMVLPAVAKEGELPLWEKRLKTYAKAGVRGIVTGNPWAVHMVEKMGDFKEIIGDFSLQYTNGYTAEFWREQGLCRLGISPELNCQQLGALPANIGREALVFGNLQMMLSEHCPLGACVGGRTAEAHCQKPCLRDVYYELRDEKGFSFPLRTDEFCRSHLYNGHLLCLIEDLPRLIAAGISVLRLDLLHFRDREIREITKIFHMALQMAAGGFSYDYTAAKKQIAEIAKRPFTKGHYYRGVE